MGDIEGALKSSDGKGNGHTWATIPVKFRHQKRVCDVPEIVNGLKTNRKNLIFSVVFGEA